MPPPQKKSKEARWFSVNNTFNFHIKSKRRGRGLSGWNGNMLQLM